MQIIWQNKKSNYICNRKQSKFKDMNTKKGVINFKEVEGVKYNFDEFSYDGHFHCSQNNAMVLEFSNEGLYLVFAENHYIDEDWDFKLDRNVEYRRLCTGSLLSSKIFDEDGNEVVGEVQFSDNEIESLKNMLDDIMIGL